MRKLLLLSLALIVPGLVSAQPTSVNSGAKGGGMFAVPEAGTLGGLKSLAAWSGSPQGGNALKGRGNLASFQRIDFNDVAQVRALAPLVEKLSDRQRASLENIASLSEKERGEILDQLQQSVQDAGLAAAGTVKEHLAAAIEKDDADTWTSLASDVKPLAIYGSWAEPLAGKLEAKAQKAREKKTVATVAATAEKLKTRSAAERITKVEGNVVHVDFSGRPNTVPADWKGATVITMPSPEERTPPAWAKAQQKELRRQINNNEILLGSELGKNASKISQDLRERSADYGRRLLELERKFPRLIAGVEEGSRRTDAGSAYASSIFGEPLPAYGLKLAQAEELAHFIYWKNRMPTLWLTGRWSQARAIRKDVRYPLSNENLVYRWKSLVTQLDTLKSQNPAIGNYYPTATDPFNELKSTRRAGLSALAMVSFLIFWLWLRGYVG